MAAQTVLTDIVLEPKKTNSGCRKIVSPKDGNLTIKFACPYVYIYEETPPPDRRTPANAALLAWERSNFALMGGGVEAPSIFGPVPKHYYFRDRG